MTDEERREYRQMMGRLADSLDSVDRLVTKLSMAEARLTHLESARHVDRQLIDQTIAWVYGADALPELTMGAQAFKCMKGTTSGS